VWRPNGSGERWGKVGCTLPQGKGATHKVGQGSLLDGGNARALNVSASLGESEKGKKKVWQAGGRLEGSCQGAVCGLLKTNLLCEAV